MKKLFYLTVIMLCIVAQQACVTQQHATTIERDKDNGCTVQMVIQLGIDGTDNDVDSVRMDLENCFAHDCVIPCSNDSSHGCVVHTSLVVKKWSTIPTADTIGFHHIHMVPQDDLPSFVNAVGTANGGPTGGTWRRNAYPQTYCHEVLHLCGLPDHYCSRIWDSINNKIIADVKCNPGPDPHGDTCCNPRAPGVIAKRCGTDCPGHEHDLMSNLSSSLSCDNILEIVGKAGLASCPEECCKKSPTYTTPKFYFDDTDTNKVYMGGSINFGYGGLYTVDKYNPANVLKQTYNGFNLGASFDVKYKINDDFKFWGRLMVVDYSRVEHTEHDNLTQGGINYENTSHTGFEFHQTGLDAMVMYEPIKNFNIYGGPGVEFNWLSTYNAHGMSTFEVLGNKQTISYGDKKYTKIDPNVWKNNVVTGSFNLGLSYDLPLCDHWMVSPFLQTRFPFNSPLSYKAAPKAFKDYQFNVAAGASFTLGVF